MNTVDFRPKIKKRIIENTWADLETNNYEAICIRKSYCENVGQISCAIAPATAGIMNSLNAGDIEAVGLNQADISQCPSHTSNLTKD